MKSLEHNVWNKSIRYNRKRFGVKFPFDSVKIAFGMWPNYDGHMFMKNTRHPAHALFYGLRDNMMWLVSDITGEF